jgi:hypothetical protein
LHYTKSDDIGSMDYGITTSFFQSNFLMLNLG